MIKTYQKKFKDILIGYSGHENGVSIPIASYALGARIIEKHFTIDRTSRYRSTLSLSSGLRRLIRDLIRTSSALGDGIKRMYEVEKLPLSKMTKILVSKKKLKKNHILKKKDLMLKINGILNGFKQNQLEEVVGKKLKKNIEKEEIITKKILID